jgi:purine-nucleoside phosphorylase
MEAAALYTFARVAKVRVLCLAHVTNTMGQSGADFEKGEADGTADALSLLTAIAQSVSSELSMTMMDRLMAIAAQLGISLHLARAENCRR